MPANALLYTRKSPVAPSTTTDTSARAKDLYETGGRLRRAGKRDEAIAAYDAALKLQPVFPEALRAGADILRELGNVDAALNFLAEAIRQRPSYVEAALDRGNLFCAGYRYEDALATFEAALAHVPGHAGLLTNQGIALHHLGRLAEAETCLEAALAADPKLPQAHLNHANVLARLGRHDEALPGYDRAIDLSPNYPAAHSGRGLALMALGHFAAADAALATALAQDPDNAYARTNRGKLRLLHGDFAQGLPDYEARLLTEWQNLPLLRRDVPFWNGQALAGQRIVAFADQGAGDVIHFVRYVPMLIAAGAEVTVVCRPRLQRMLRPLMQGVRVVESVDDDAAFDLQIPFSSLPTVLATRLETIPATVCHLTAEADRVAAWAARLGAHEFKVGLCWRGSQDWRADPHRSVPLYLLGALAALPGVRLVSLQVDEDGAPLPIWLEQLDDVDTGPDGFVDTAAIMANLDLIVSCDTSLAHLAGSLGRPTFLLLQHVPEWRWLLERADTPWYPTMRLFRQPTRGDWVTVIDQVAEALTQAVAAAR